MPSSHILNIKDNPNESYIMAKLSMDMVNRKYNTNNRRYVSSKLLNSIKLINSMSVNLN